MDMASGEEMTVSQLKCPLGKDLTVVPIALEKKSTQNMVGTKNRILALTIARGTTTFNLGTAWLVVGYPGSVPMEQRQQRLAAMFGRRMTG